MCTATQELDLDKSVCFLTSQSLNTECDQPFLLSSIDFGAKLQFTGLSSEGHNHCWNWNR